MRNRLWSLACGPLLAGLVFCSGGGAPVFSPPPPPPPPPGAGDVHLDASLRYQTITGWETHPQSGDENAAFPAWRNQLFDLAVNDLGITRIRLEVRSGMENTRDVWLETRAGMHSNAVARCLRFATVNDNADPAVTDPSGFHYGFLDHQVEQIALPLKQRLEARGERLFINLNYVAFIEQMIGSSCPPGLQYHHTTPAEYAEFMLEMVRHLDTKYGLVPDAIEFLLEPEHNAQWSGLKIGQGIVAAAARLAAAGYSIKFIAPSTTNMANAITYFDAMMQTPGVAAHLLELSYHRYGGVSDANLRAIAARATQRGIGTAMLEHIGSGHEALHKDLVLGNASSWQQFALAYPTDDNGAQYYTINTTAGTVTMGSRTRYLRQYFRWVRPGAQRIAASSSRPGLDPVAFVHPTLGTVVVVKAATGANFTISGLPAGTYGIAYTTATATGTELPPVTIAPNAVLQTGIPAPGVITVFRQ